MPLPGTRRGLALNMEPRYRTPQELVAGLHARRAGARAQLWQLLRAPLDRLMGELIARHGLDEDRELLTRHALHSAETDLRTRPPGAFAGLSWAAFRGAILLQMAKLTVNPYGAGGRDDLSGALSLPESRGWVSRTFFRPSVRLGKHFFGGDWYAGRQLDDGSFWVFLADVTGHGYYAYLLASGLPGVWQRCWSDHPDHPPEPAELLARMHELLADCLPEGIFLEATLVRLGEDGRTTVVAAGGTRFWLCRGSSRPDLVKLRGAWLGLRAPHPEDQHTLTLGHGDELLLTTDGVFDQLDGGEVVERHGPPGEVSLFEVVRELLEQSLANGPQKDDITLVLLRRRDPTGAVEVGEPASLTPGRNGMGDVPM
jgi:hypothetical protein